MEFFWFTVLQDFMLPYHNAHTFLQCMQAILSSGGGGEQEVGAGSISEKSGIWPVTNMFVLIVLPRIYKAVFGDD